MKNNRLLVKTGAGLLCAALTMVIALPLMAQTSPPINQVPASNTPYVAPINAPEPNDISSASSADSHTSVFVGGTSIMRVRFASGGFTAEQRARSIQERVNRMLGQGPIDPSDITVAQVDPTDAAVYVKGQLLFTADKATANFNSSTPIDLAQSWASTMRRLLPDLTKPA